ncbi:MAG: TldD/PmbA family protein [Candidatus Hodarchaeales archaeon]|jgi:predicted Zn-dependent protease
MKLKKLEILESIAETVLQLTDKYELDSELNLQYINSATSRYANSQIIQNMEGDRASIAIRVAKGKKITNGSTNDITTEGLKILIEDLAQSVSHVPDNPYFDGFLDNNPETIYPQLNLSSQPWDTEARADTIASVISIAESIQNKVKMAGTCTSYESQSLFISSNGRKYPFYFTSNIFKVNAIISRGEERGYGQKKLHWRKEMPKFNELAEEAVKIAQSTAQPLNYSPGEYKVVLSPQAVSDLLTFLQYNLEASAYHEGRSFATDALCAQLFDEKFDFTDKPLDPVKAHISIPIDVEGAPRSNKKCIDKGKVVFIPYSSFRASQYLKDKNLSTGNAFGQNFAICASLVQELGSSKFEDLLKDVQNGIYVNEFSYTRFTDPRKGGLTGLTRNGTFEIKNGELGRAVNNLRYTDSFLSAFGPENIISTGNDYVMNQINTTVALALNKFKFTSKANVLQPGTK